MRMDGRLPQSAEDLVNTAGEEELADIIYRYGEEHRSRAISRAIVQARVTGRITSGAALAAVVERAKHRTGKTHPATRVFQALRIAVNRELESLKAFLDSAPGMLASGGRTVIISYHSLEDRIVKQDFRNKGSEGAYRVLTKKVVFASESEVKENPRSRSARLRCAEKI
jgi:16S rRNA (cytosine1402-N4)-methyltransferase